MEKTILLVFLSIFEKIYHANSKYIFFRFISTNKDIVFGDQIDIV